MIAALASFALLVTAQSPARADAADPRAELADIRGRAADRLFRDAGAAAKAGRFALADECLRAVIARRPDHPEARRLLGHVPYEGGWATPHAVKKRQGGWVSHPV